MIGRLNPFRRCRAGGKSVFFGRLRCSRGQALIEFALVLAPLMLVFMGIIDFGFLLSDVIGVRQGVGDTARQAAVGQFGSNTSCTLAGAGSASTNAKALLCLAHSQDSINNDAITRVAIVVGDTGSSTYAVGAPVTICEEYALRSLSGFTSPLLNGHFATVVATERVETLTTGGLSAAQETALSGSSWSFCTAPAPVS